MAPSKSNKLAPLKLGLFLDVILPTGLPIPKDSSDNAIEERHVIVYGRQGVGKSNCARWLVQQAKSRYGEQEVNERFASGENFRSLIDNPDWGRQYIQILIVEDLTMVKLRVEDISDFFRIRHVMKKRTGSSYGLCLVIFTCHRYHSIPNEFRSAYDGFIALSAPIDPYDKRFIENIITPDGVAMLNSAEADRQRGLAVACSATLNLIGNFAIPYVSSDTIQKTGIRVRNEPTTSRGTVSPSGPSSHKTRSKKLPDEGSYDWQDRNDPLQLLLVYFRRRWENWDLENEDKKVLTGMSVCSAFLLLVSLVSSDFRLTVLALIGMGGLAVAYYMSDQERADGFRRKLHLD